MRAVVLGGLVALLGVGTLALAPTSLISAAPTSQATPPDTGAFDGVWNRTDSLVASSSVARSWFWGPSETAWTTRELYVDDPTGRRSRLVRYYDKSRMEINNPNGNHNDAFYVSNGLLTVELISGRMQVGNNTFESRYPANIVIAGDSNDPAAPTYASFALHANAGTDHPDANRVGQQATATIARNGTTGNDPTKAGIAGIQIAFYEGITRHNIPQVMWDFLNASGPVKRGDQTVTEPLATPWFYATGLPISDAYWARVLIRGVPTDTLIQAYERRVLTYTPSNPTGFKLEMGNIGAHYRDWRYFGAGR